MTKRTDFFWTEKPEPHSYRRQAILKKYPEITKMYKYDIPSLIFCTTTVLIQYLGMYLVSLYDPDWKYLVPLAWIISGTMGHSLALAGHELCHCTFLPTRLQNELYSIFSNTGSGIPSALTFKRYHLEHHTAQGVDGLDVDLPTQIEGNYINNVITKFLFLLTQPLFYALRPGIVYPKKISYMELLNQVVIVAFDIAVYYFLGFKSLFYLVIGTYLGLAFHPISGHFLAEHYTTNDKQETYSYYGFWNYFVYNAGYHVEHHDFPLVPGRLLPQVRKTASEFYDILDVCDSWGAMLFKFLFSDNLGCFSRIKRVRIASRESVNRAQAELEAEVEEYLKSKGNDLTTNTVSEEELEKILQQSVDESFDKSEILPTEGLNASKKQK